MLGTVCLKLYMIKKKGAENSLVERRKNRYGERRNYFGISHGKDERTDKI